jgi:hypothetical protein
MRPTFAAGAASDAASVAEVFLEAMAPNALQHAQFPDPAGEHHVRDWFAQDVARHVRDADKGLLVARSEEGEIISFIKWQVHQGSESQEHPATEEQHEWPATSDTAVLEAYTALTARVREDVLGKEGYYRAFPRATAKQVVSEAANLGHRCVVSLHKTRICRTGCCVRAFETRAGEGGRGWHDSDTRKHHECRLVL